MSKMMKFSALLIAAALAFTPLSARAGDPKVVLELFTSQGCSSCPSADAYLGELAATRDDVVALSFHVDYWNYIGWTDPFSSAEWSNRQRAYATEMWKWGFMTMVSLYKERNSTRKKFWGG